MVGKRVSAKTTSYHSSQPTHVKSFPGDSLGKTTQGIKVPIKAHRKTNLAGLGSSTTADITGNNWWERVYNEASDNLNVDKNANGQVTVSKKDEEGVEITNKSYSFKKLREKTAGRETYGGKFIKAATLLADVGEEKEIADHVKTEDIQVAATKTLTDAELFAACGGLTAHKGARHGLKLTGKLNRMKEQDDALLAQLQQRTKPIQEGIFREIGTNKDDLKTPEWQNGKEKLKKPNFHISSVDDHPNVSEDELTDVLNIANYSKHSKKKRQKVRKTEKELIEKLEAAFGAATPTNNEEDSDGDAVCDEQQSKKIKKKSKLEKISSESRTIQKKDTKGTDYLTEKALEMLGSGDETPKVSKSSRKRNKKRKKALAAGLQIEPTSSKQSKVKLKTDSGSESSANEEDVVERINEEMHHLSKKRRIDRCDEEITGFQEEHKKRLKKFKNDDDDSWKVGKKKLSKKQKKMEKNLCKKMEETIQI